jgi:membrane protease YdiL (CAAX protease family)
MTDIIGKKAAEPDLLAVLVLSIVVPIAASMVAIFLCRAVVADAYVENLAMTAAAGVACLVVYASWARRRGWLALGQRFAPTPRRALLLAVALCLGIEILFEAVEALLPRIGVALAHSPKSTLDPATWRQLLLFLPVAVAIVPLYEELLFRGLLLGWLRRRLPVWAAVALNSVIFAAVHDNNLNLGLVGWLDFTQRAVIGVALAWLALRFGSLRGPVLMHAATNLIAGLYSVLFPEG